MNVSKEKRETIRLESVVSFIARLAKSDYKTRIPVSGKGDETDLLAVELNNLADTLETREAIISNDKKRLDELSEILLGYILKDFSKKASLSEQADEIDAISAGLNALREELDFSFQTQKKYAIDLENSNRQLSESAEKIQAIFDNAPDAIIASDLNFNITEWNNAAEKMYGFTREEVLGKSADEIINSEHVFPETRLQASAKLRATGSWAGELIQSTTRKEKMIVLCSTSFLNDASGAPIGYLGVTRDLTQFKKTNEALSTSEARFHLLVNEITDYAIIMLDTKGRIISWNKGAEKINGYHESEITGEHFSIFYPEEDQLIGLPETGIREAVKNGKCYSSGWRIRKDKSKFWADVVITKLVDQAGNLQGFVKITKDLTDQRRIEDEIRQKSEELKRSNTELEQFAYVASHDLQEPLRMITSYVQLLEKHYKDKLDQDAHDFINFAVDGANRMQTLIYSLLEFSRINRVKPFETIDLDDTLREVIKDLELSINETQAKITWEKLPDIYGDKILIGQLFMNLISNAIKFKGDSPPEIKISCRKKSGEYLFTVTDNGIGIKKEYSEKIFVIFQRLHSKDKYSGTGIGLAICKKIVERHGGKIWVESELNEGSSFNFTIKRR